MARKTVWVRKVIGQNSYNVLGLHSENGFTIQGNLDRAGLRELIREAEAALKAKDPSGAVAEAIVHLDVSEVVSDFFNSKGEYVGD